MMKYRSRPATWGIALALAASLGAAVACGPGKTNGPAVKDPERQSDAEHDLALDEFSHGRTRAALDHVQRALEMNPDNERALYLASIIHLAFCDGDRELLSPDCKLVEAEKYARQALKQNEKLRDARNLLGQILILEKRFKEAEGVLEPLTRDPAYRDAHLAWGNFGWAQVQGGDIDRGIQSLKNAITDPRFCVGHYRLVVAFEKKGDFAQADKSLSDALAVDDPKCQSLQVAWDNRARVRMRLGRADDARKDFEKCVSLSDKTPTGKACVQSLASLGPGGKS
jgi:Tfp pilus assembly protein PilF